MSTLTINGKATIIGLDGTATYGTVAYTLLGANLTEETPTGKLEDGRGNIVSESFGDPQHTLAIEFTPISTTGNSIADAKGLAKLPVAGSIVVIASTNLPAYDGNWNYAGKGEIMPAQGQNPLKMKLTLTRNGAPSGGYPTAFTAASA